MQKKGYRIALLIMIVCMLAACQNKNIVTKGPDGEDISEEPVGSLYGFTEFDFSVDTKDKKEAIQAMYKEGRVHTEANYLNKVEDTYLRGNKALKKLDEIFSGMSVDPETEDMDLIKQATEAFEISDYEKASLKIKFKGHDQKDLMFSK
ncbi:YusW family protein [Sporosarcina sp. 179-K 3D1 HS]|uniref:YusW family protein n=1 Tax=Sporosarcina sp. 179-K 3D1 HS TaxID=3232169 RepID=UPI0039A381F5